MNLPEVGVVRVLVERFAVCLVCVVSASAQAVWTKRPITNAPLARQVHDMVYDSGRGCGVLFGGLVEPVGPRMADTWELWGNVWIQKLPAVAPSGRDSCAMAYDAQRGKTVLFGGAVIPSFFNDTWEWDGSVWTKILCTTSPSPRAGHRMVFDAMRRKIVLFGGADLNAVMADTWEWDGVNWQAKTPTTAPPGRCCAGFAFDAVRGRAVLYGGTTDVSPFTLKDTWEWDGANWQMKSPQNIPSTYGDRLVYDNVRGACVLFDPVTPSNLWKWNGLDWSMTNSVGGPTTRRGSSCYFDGSTGTLVTFGGIDLSRNTGDVWTWDGTLWRLAVAPGSPSVASLCYDTARGRTVGLGVDDVWDWDGNMWSRKAPNPKPTRGHDCWAYDAGRSRTVLFIGKPQRATWEWDGSNWTQRFPFVFPSDLGVMAYDSVRQRVVLYDGTARETWEWNGSTWTVMASGVGPPGFGAMAYDAARSQMVWAGGYVFNTTSPMQTWTWDGSQWQMRTPATNPVARGGAGIAYDARRQVVVVFGGETTNLSTGTTLRDDVWEWNGSTWTGVGGNRPAAQIVGGPMAYDTQRACIVLFGNDGTWEYGPAQRASCVPYGVGCGGSAMPVLASDRGSVPWLGDTFQSKLTNLGSSGPGFVMLGDSKSAWGSYALPLDLGFIGMTNCMLLANPSLSFGVGNVGGTAIWSLPLPNDQRFAGTSLYAQGGGMSAPANPLGIVVSNGLTLTAGWK